MSELSDRSEYLILYNTHLPFEDVKDSHGAWPHTYFHSFSQKLPAKMTEIIDPKDVNGKQWPTLVVGDVNSRSLCDKENQHQEKDTDRTWPVTQEGKFDDSLLGDGPDYCTTCALFVPRHVLNNPNQTQQQLYQNDAIMIFSNQCALTKDITKFHDISPITFMPTYKIHYDTYQLYKKNQLRLPGYADRILCNAEMDQHQCALFTKYSDIPNKPIELFGARCPVLGKDDEPTDLEYDHRPVYGYLRWLGLIDLHIYTWNMGTGKRDAITAKRFITHQMTKHTSTTPTICVFCFQETKAKASASLSNWSPPNIKGPTGKLWNTTNQGAAFGLLWKDFRIRTYTYWTNLKMPDPLSWQHTVSAKTETKPKLSLTEVTGQKKEKRFNTKLKLKQKQAAAAIKKTKAAVATSPFGTKGSVMTVFQLSADNIKKLRQ